MFISTSDLLAVLIALIAVNTVLILAFRRVYELEKQVLKLRRENKALKSW